MKRLGSALCAAAQLACAHPRTAWPPESGGYAISVTVDNDLVTRSDVLIRIVASSGASSLLGGAAPGQEKAFDYRERILAGSYTLTASTGDGRLLRSRSFTLFPGAIVIWQIQQNVLVVRGSEPGGGLASDADRPRVDR